MRVKGEGPTLDVLQGEVLGVCAAVDDKVGLFARETLKGGHERVGNGVDVHRQVIPPNL